MTELQKDTSIDPETLFPGSFVQNVARNEFCVVRSILYNSLLEVDYITDKHGRNLNLDLIKAVPIDKTFHEACWIKRNAFGQYVYETPLTQGEVQNFIFTDQRLMLRQPNQPRPDLVVIWDNELRGRSMFVHEFQFMYLLITGKKLIFDLNHLINNQTNGKH